MHSSKNKIYSKNLVRQRLCRVCSTINVFRPQNTFLFAMEALLLYYLIFRLLVDEENEEYEAPGTWYTYCV
jgi:hypothetical protein